MYALRITRSPIFVEVFFFFRGISFHCSMQVVRYKRFILPGTAATNGDTFVMSNYPERLAVTVCKLVVEQQRAQAHPICRQQKL
jgi:hypothetical protein